jgi:hypothetical protein
MRFHNGELFRIVVTYDRYKVEGMTASDMIQAISMTYTESPPDRPPRSPTILSMAKSPK